MLEVAADDARRIALRQQGFLVGQPRVPRDAGRRVGSVRGMLDALGAVQLDTISVLARSHELVAYARLGAVGRAAVEEAYWQGDTAFEYWSHAACILPMESWPAFAFRRRSFRAKGERWHGVPRADLTSIVARVRDEGPITTSDLGGAKRAGAWWDWSDAKIGLEWLLDIGTLVVTRRVGWRRTYDLAERVVPAHAFHDDLDDDACLVRLVGEAARTVGIGTAADIADVHRLPKAAVTRHAEQAGLVEVSVPGWARTWVTQEALDWLASTSPRHDRHRTTLLSPFDSLIWFRARVERIFGMRHRIEAYTPAAKRVHGYFAMPVLHGGALVARVDPKREGSVLHARTVTLERTDEAAVVGTGAALREAAAWVGCDDVRIGTVTPRRATSALRAAVHSG